MIAINLTGDDFKRHATAMDIVPVKKKESTSVKLLQYCIPREKTRLSMTFIDASAAITLLEEGLEKYSGFERDSNSRPLRCWCRALSTELSKPQESGRMLASPFYVDVILGPSIVKSEMNFVH